ncbi:acyl carrier protein [Phytohabitans sp. ZYX-F-186]|uniref:Acyl carrier protein n=1 Tax=Phytohabitans maris TaxID=3071409 RepID=A0ABU0Z7G7_9ACTN|nr:acyl carrier protein [Phytohabitans sp. ZYX-F-186]MDQ7903000.1 acyl carrier protein [Phytohabitans sp. ZYX-F-186]
MPQETSATRLRALAAEVFDVPAEEITDGAAFYEDLGVDSLQKVDFVVRMERQLGLKLTDDEAAGMRDLGGAITVLRSRGLSVGP